MPYALNDSFVTDEDFKSLDSDSLVLEPNVVEFFFEFLIEMYQNSDTVFISPKAAANICTDSLKNNAHNSVEKHKFLLPLQEKTTGMWFMVVLDLLQAVALLYTFHDADELRIGALKHVQAIGEKLGCTFATSFADVTAAQKIGVDASIRALAVAYSLAAGVAIDDESCVKMTRKTLKNLIENFDINQ